VSPSGLLELDGRWLAALELAEADRWSIDRELAAAAVELLHAIWCTLLAAHGGKRARIPEPLKIPRPDSARPRPITLGPAELARVFPSHVREVSDAG
jgi:hypothetical protein